MIIDSLLLITCFFLPLSLHFQQQQQRTNFLGHTNSLGIWFDYLSSLLIFNLTLLNTFYFVIFLCKIENLIKCISLKCKQKNKSQTFCDSLRVRHVRPVGSRLLRPVGGVSPKDDISAAQILNRSVEG